MTAQPARYAVAQLNLQGEPRFSSHPHMHHSTEEAHAEAKRLATQHPGKKFMVYAEIGYYEVPAPSPVFVQLAPAHSL